MHLIINGKEEEIAFNEGTLWDLFMIKKVDAPDMVNVELNGTILKREQHKTMALNNGDKIELLYFMGGGSGENLRNASRPGRFGTLAGDQMERYSRHILLKDVGGAGQEKLLNARVLVIGAGALGAPALYYLAAAGVGTLGIADGDSVDLSNLQRQILHFTRDVGRRKVDSAGEKLTALNPDVSVVAHPYRALAANIPGLVENYDFIIDGTDNFPAKFLINDACVLSGKPFSHGAILRFSGQTLTWVPGSPCYRCIFPEPPPKDAVPSCSQAGVLGAVAGILGSIQAAEALRYILGLGKLLTGRLLVMNALDMEFRTVEVKRAPGCPVCGGSPTVTRLVDEELKACDLNPKAGVS